MKIDLHVHVRKVSNCAKETPEAMAKAALEKGLEGIVILDHNYQITREECDQVEKAVPGIMVFGGIELSVFDEHVVIIPTETIDFAPEYKRYMDNIKFLQEWIDRTGSLAILAHPYRYHTSITFDMDIFTPHAVEVAGRHVRKSDRIPILQLAKDYGMGVVSVSDAHKTRQLGNYCINTYYDIDNEKELINCIKRGNYSLMESRLEPVKL